jgi:non-ribosomal peptide synthetase component F
MSETYLDLFNAQVHRNGSKTALVESEPLRRISFDELDAYAGRIATKMLGSGVRRQDSVALVLQNGIDEAAAILAVMKLGAVVVPLNMAYPQDRLQYIYDDCSARLVVTSDFFADIDGFDPLPAEYPRYGEDIAMLIYTSGSTGNPKGVIIDQKTLTHSIHPVVSDSDVFGLGAPFFFIAGSKSLFNGLAMGSTGVIIPMAVMREPAVLSTFLAEQDVTVTFISPRVLKYFKPTGSKLKKVMTGSERLSGIWSDKFEIINTYGQSETIAGVLSFRVDQPYDNTPIGKPMGDAHVYLLDDNGNDSDEGEICMAGHFAKGYLNLPEETARTFIANPFKDIDGYDTLVRTGDLGKRLPDGNIVYLNRKDWMIKINGQRVEPGEIETVLNHVPGVAQAAVKDFQNSYGQTFLCAFYVPLKTPSVKLTEGMLRAAVASRLPSYMHPLFYVKLDKMPINPNGKLDRKQLTAPKVEDYQAGYYLAPTTETEEKLCKAMAKVLDLPRVGINDDFYRLGGDSISTVALIVESGLTDLNATQVFKGRTVSNIAKIYDAAILRKDKKDPDVENEKALKTEHPLTVEQLYMVDYQLYTPASTMYNLFLMMRIDKKEYRLDRIAKAFEDAIRSHPALLTTFGYNQQNQLVQRYTPEVFEKIRVEHLTEFELKFVRDTLVYPYKIIGGRLYRCRVFETEEAGYVFFDVHHTVFDGSSFKLFFQSISASYQGAEPVKDYYYLMLRQREDAVLTDYYRESKEYFERRYDGIRWDSHPRIDHSSRDNETGEIYASLGVEETQILAAEQAYHVSRNELFIAVAALAIAIYNDSSDILLTWIYNGRNDMLMMSSVGLLYRDLPVGLRFNDRISIREICADVKDQVRKGIEYSCYPYVELKDQVGESESACLLYQQDMRGEGSLEGFNVDLIDVKHNQAASQTILDIQILDDSSGPKLMIDYSASRYLESSIDKFKDLFTKITQEIASHLAGADLTVGEIRSKVSENGFASVDKREEQD